MTSLSIFRCSKAERMSLMLRMETRHAADARDTSPSTNLSVVDEKDAAGEVAAVVKAAVEDAVVKAVVKVMGRKMMT